MQTIFKHYLQNQWNGGSAAFELKRSTTDRVSVNAVLPHQLDALNAAYEAALYYKIPDDSVGYKPFDCFVLQQSLAYVVIGFGAKLTSFDIIPIWVWLEKTKRKTSVTRTEVLKWDDVISVPIPTKKS